MNPSRPSLLRRSVLLAIGIVFGVSVAAVPAQATGEDDTAAVLERLREGDVAAALDAAGTTVDAATPQPLADLNRHAAVAGGLFRVLSQDDADEQYELLYEWTMPSGDRHTVRLLTSTVPREAPPSDFARAIGERPRETSFPIAEIAGVTGLYSTGWQLLRAADEIGRLGRLITELEPLAADGVPNASDLLLLARLLDADAATEPLTRELQTRIDALAPNTEPLAAPKAPPSASTVAIAAAALRIEDLRSQSEALFDRLVSESLAESLAGVRPFLRFAHAAAVQLHRGESSPAEMMANRLKYWIPVNGTTAAASAQGAVPPVWLVHEDHILHLSGSGHDVLLFRYPLTGEFGFHCETQEGGDIGTDGGLVYGGLQFEALGRTNQLTVWDADGAHAVQRPCPFVRHEARPTFNRVGIRSQGGEAQFLANLHPVWRDGSDSERSPWLGLRSFAERRPMFRNLKLSGSPAIPREVFLTNGATLRGWQSGFFGETKPPFVPAAEEPAAAADWTLADGTLQAAARQDADRQQSLLRYQRPLLENETIRYEFYYEPGTHIVHPAFGRMAFLIEPGGVRVHWITDGQTDWTGLPADNALMEPLNRRGGARLELKASDWNAIALTRNAEGLTLSLNGTEIYQRTIDFAGSEQFGLFRDPATSTVQVRNVVLSGDWPETLPEDCLENPATLAQTPPAEDRLVSHRLAGEPYLAENVRDVRQRAARLSAEKQYEFLLEHILPGPDHPGVRVVGAFTQTEAAPPNYATEGRPGDFFSSVISPVFDLLDVTAELDLWNDLQHRIGSLPESTDADEQRARLALRLLIALEQQKDEQVTTLMEPFYESVFAAQPAGLSDMWPELLVIWRGFEQPAVHPGIAELITSLYSRRSANIDPLRSVPWHVRVSSLLARHTMLNDPLARRTSTVTNLQSWIPTIRAKARTRGTGYPEACWVKIGDTVYHIPGHEEELLFYHLPLRGNFEIACDLGGHGTTQFMAAGTFCAARGRFDEIETGTFRNGVTQIQKIDPPLTKHDPFIRHRAVFKDGTCTISVNGIEVHHEPLSELHDPWIAVRSWWRNTAKLRDLRIVGEPEIPEQVEMSASESLIEWLTYYDESIASPKARWQWVEDPDSTGQILGLRILSLIGTNDESLLRYHRPLDDNGSIEYDFFYEPGISHTHPALDRLAFLLDPNGVRIHWLTDGAFDPTTLGPGNAFDEPQHRRGPDNLPLKEGDWNHLKLALAGQTVTLELNGTLIYERPLEPENTRTFGLFHYADTEARVRNVTMRGDWPKSLPEPSRQELADPIAASLNDPLGADAVSHTFDFRDGDVMKNLKITNSDVRGQIILHPHGLQISQQSPGSWNATAASLPFSLYGDFDVEAEFEDLHLQSDKYANIMLDVHIDDDRKRQCRFVRTRSSRPINELTVSISELRDDGSRTFPAQARFASESTRGRTRLSRRGDVLHFLFAEHDSDIYQLIGSEVISDKPTELDGIKVRAMIHGNGEARVIWKSVTIRAEQIKHLPPEAQSLRHLHVMNLDGTNLEIIAPVPPGFTQMGSPEWSADGTKIAFDSSNGSTATSHIIVVDSDGDNMTDLGAGCMPSFSPDGKRLVCSVPGEGIVMLNADGSGRQVVDRNGWGTQWSPDGRSIAWGRGNNITIFDTQSGAQRPLLTDEQAAQLRYIYWNLGWSHDSRWIAFKAQLPTGNDDYAVAVANIDATDEFKIIHRNKRINADFTWMPDNRRVLFAAGLPPTNQLRLVTVDRTTAGDPEPVPGLPEKWQYFDGDISPDGKRITFSALKPAEPVDWTPSAAQTRGRSRKSLEANRR